jgi:hypothetical protein
MILGSIGYQRSIFITVIARKVQSSRFKVERAYRAGIAVDWGLESLSLFARCHKLMGNCPEAMQELRTNFDCPPGAGGIPWL